jgi:hypothetical protein
VNPAMTIEADRHDVLKIVEPLADPPLLVMHFSRQLVTNLTLEVLPQER